MSIHSQSLLSLVCSNLMLLSFLSTRHSALLLRLDFVITFPIMFT